MSTTTSPLQPEEVHTFPGICDDHPPDDLSTIALSPLDDVATLQPEEMQTDDSFRPRPEVLPVAGPGLVELQPMLPISRVARLTSTVNAPLPHAQLPFPVPQQQHAITAVPHGVVFKQEIPSPTDLAIPGTSTAAYPDTSGPSASGGVWGRPTSGTLSPLSPVIPITALELLNQESSSSSSDNDSPQTHEKSATGSDKSKRSSTSGKMLDRRKASDDGDSDDEDFDDMAPEDQGRLDRRRLSNRVAAQKCRHRQRTHHRGLMKEIQDWECKNTGLNYEVRQLQKTLRQMLDEVKTHEASCSTAPPVLTPAEREAYQKLLDDVTAAHSQSKDSPKSSK